MAGLARTWPLFVELVRECTPRDAAAPRILVSLWKRVGELDPARGRALVKRLFEAYTKRHSEHMTGVSVRGPLSWSAVYVEEQRAAVLAFQSGGSSADPAALQAAAVEAVRLAQKAQQDAQREHQAARKLAKEQRDREAALEAAAGGEGEQSPAASTPSKKNRGASGAGGGTPP